MLTKRRRMRVALVAAVVPADVRLVGRVDVRVLLPVGAVGEASAATVELASKRLLAFCKHSRNEYDYLCHNLLPTLHHF